MAVFYLVLYLLAWICFLIAVLSPDRPWSTRVNMVALGLLFWVSVPLIHAIKAQ